MMNDKFIVMGDIVESNGKTVRENNSAIAHKIPIGSLVEIVSEDDEFEWIGVRMYVVDHSRDCDGTPLYVIGPKCARDKWDRHGGFGEDNLKLVGDL